MICPKSKRAGFLWPEEEEGNGGNFVAPFWVGTLEHYKDFLVVEEEVVVGVVQKGEDLGGWIPTTPPGSPPSMNANGEDTWTPMTPPGTPPTNNNGGDATWRPETPPQEGNGEAPPTEDIWKPPTDDPPPFVPNEIPPSDPMNSDTHGKGEDNSFFTNSAAWCSVLEAILIITLF